MIRNYEQLVIKAPFTLLKGFVLGFKLKSDDEFKYFFNRKFGIKRETLSEHLMQFLNMDQYSFLCIDREHTDEFVEALKTIDGYGVEVIERAEIDFAEFSLEVHVYNRHLSSECEKILQFRDPSIEISQPEADEIFDETGSPKAHAYTYHLETMVSGPFEHVMNLYLEFSRSELKDFVMCGEIELKTLHAIGS